MGYVGQAPSSGGVTSSDIVDLAIVNADVNASAALAFSKLAALSDGNILVGSSGNVPTSVNPSGDVDVSNAGVFSIASDSVINADIKSDAAIAISKLATITLATNTSGDYVQNITAGTSLTSSGATSGENIAHSLSVDAATTSAAGSVELATTAELDTGTDTSRAVTPDVLAASVFGERVIQFGVVAPATDVATGDDQAHFLVPSTLNGFDVVEVHAEFITAGVTGANTIMIRNDTAGANILSTGIDIDTGETGSDTGGGYTIDTAQDDLTTNDLIAIDVDLVSTGTAPKGLIVTMVCRKP